MPLAIDFDFRFVDGDLLTGPAVWLEQMSR